MNALSDTGTPRKFLPSVHLLCLVGVLFIMGGNVSAATLTAWTLTGTLDDGGTISGSFDYLADLTNPAYSLLNITVIDPDLGTQTWTNAGPLPGGTALIATNANSIELEIYFDPSPFHPLANGGTVTFTGTGLSDVFQDTSPYYLTDFVTGSATGAIVNATPEPGTASIMLIGALGLLGVKRWRRSLRASR